jgi:hypothetical protein
MAAHLYKVLDDVEIFAISVTETLGVVQGDARIHWRDDPLIDI